MAASQVDIAHINPPQDAVAPPRKRRKRTTTAGAAADCFACQTSSLQCDRRRPYCSQCINQGKDCSGYKTQLTWGVGVASRGKLRGLSLPVAGSTQKAPGPGRETKTNGRRSPAEEEPDNRSHVLKKPKVEPVSPRLSRLQNEPSTAASSSVASSLPITPNDHWPVTAHGLPPISSVSYGSEMEYPEQLPQIYHYGGMAPLLQERYTQTPPGGSTSNYRYTGRMSPAYYDGSPPQPTYPLPQPQPKASIPTPSSPMRPYRIPDLLSPEPSYGTPTSSVALNFPPSDQTMLANPLAAATTMSSDLQLASNGVVPAMGEDEKIEEIVRTDLDNEVAVVDDSSDFASPLALDLSLGLTQFVNTTNVGKTPRMQYLINYYAEVIAPVIVAFDGPSNPYRQHILQLATNSETLQHAISALSASNMRQRRETGVLSTGKTDQTRRSSMAHLTLIDETFYQAAILSPQEQAREETYHRGLAVQSLNAELANPLVRKNDSILATLLILCLFHMCDSGIAKFQTQFAGVKKLLNLRGGDLGLDGQDSAWLSRMFTWFDAIAATVNDREGQLQGHHVDLTAYSNEEWALENLAGCDGRLFKTISKLGRLNVLSQGKAVEDMPTIVSKPFPSVPFLDGDFSQVDGNGWARMIADEELFNMRTATTDVQEQFWREWREVRHDLQNWYLDTSMFDSASSAAPYLTQEQRLDLNEISESFRYAALLYTERMAHPTLASSAENIQSWVRLSLEHIRLVKADVYLLWPLFITGSECVRQTNINLIRERCFDIQKDSGFLNNKSCLELLEKLWKENPAVEGNRDEEKLKYEPADLAGVGVASGFRFSDIMRREGNDGEYIVI